MSGRCGAGPRESRPPRSPLAYLRERAVNRAQVGCCRWATDRGYDQAGWADWAPGWQPDVPSMSHLHGPEGDPSAVLGVLDQA
jgi:hypothetical protein